MLNHREIIQAHTQKWKKQDTTDTSRQVLRLTFKSKWVGETDYLPSRLCLLPGSKKARQMMCRSLEELPLSCNIPSPPLSLPKLPSFAYFDTVLILSCCGAPKNGQSCGGIFNLYWWIWKRSPQVYIRTPGPGKRHTLEWPYMPRTCVFWTAQPHKMNAWGLYLANDFVHFKNCPYTRVS